MSGKHGGDGICKGLVGEGGRYIACADTIFIFFWRKAEVVGQEGTEGRDLRNSSGCLFTE